MDFIGKKISWETSEGICSGTISAKKYSDNRFIVELLDENSKKIMSKLYNQISIIYNTEKSNLIFINVDNDFISCPKLKITFEN